MKTTTLTLLACLPLRACTPAEAETRPAAAPEPIVSDNRAGEKPAATLLEASDRAFAAAAKGRRGCEKPIEREKTLELALQVSNAALREIAAGTNDLERRQAETLILGQRFQGLGSLAEECQ